MWISPKIVLVGPIYSIDSSHGEILINPLHAKFFSENLNMYLQLRQISFFHTDMTGIWIPFSCKTRAYLFHILNIMAADDLVSQGARASATMILT